MKPIEQGCLAVIVGSKAGNDGKCVTVGRCLGKIPGWAGERRWEVDQPLKTQYGYYGPVCWHSNEAYLLRIDGDTFESEDTETSAEPEQSLTA